MAHTAQTTSRMARSAMRLVGRVVSVRYWYVTTSCGRLATVAFSPE